MTGQHLLLLLWTLWLVIALLSVGGWLGIISLLVLGPLGLGLVLTGVVSWRGYLIGALIVHVLAAALMVFVQLRPRHPVSAWMRRSLLQALLPSVQRWPLQVLAGSVSLAGLIWLLILRPAVHWLYRADIPIMIGTVAALVTAEYGCWVLFQHVDRRIEQLSQRQDALERAQAELGRTQHELRRAHDELGHAQAQLDSAQAQLRHAQGELRHLQAELREAQNELRRAQGELRQALDELRRVHDAPRAPESKPSDPPVWYHPPAGVRSQPESGQVTDAAEVRVELIRIARLSPRPESPASQTERPVGITIERRTVTISPEPGETAGEVTRRAEEHLGREIEAAAAQYAAQAIGGPAWKIVSERWAAHGSAGFDAPASSVADFDADVHNILLNQPVRQLSSWAGLPGPAPAVPGGIAGAAEMPLGRPLNAVTQIIQVGGIVVGTLSGNPFLASACLKSLAHGELIRGLETGIERIFSQQGIARIDGPADPARGPEITGPAAGDLSRPAPATETAARTAAGPAAADTEPLTVELTDGERAATQSAAVPHTARMIRNPPPSRDDRGGRTGPGGPGGPGMR